jgi:cation diffusion facilitator CzcD-associated flavoprotein CzcO
MDQAKSRRHEVDCMCERGTRRGVKEFDRIVLGDGLASKATTPEFEGMEKFRGKIIHSQAYNRYVILHGHWGFS